MHQAGLIRRFQPQNIYPPRFVELFRGKEQKKKRSICRHSPNRWVGGLGNFKKKIINLFLTLGGVKPFFYKANPTLFWRNYQRNVYFTYIFSDFCFILHVRAGF